ncbi:hypothetical protein EJ07DRAFT_173479 [Lizonia empirigonia]|nr:hypothetical protein EJ07DRAFT_173479 [Lizonia empirigonia]
MPNTSTSSPPTTIFMTASPPLHLQTPPVHPTTSLSTDTDIAPPTHHLAMQRATPHHNPQIQHRSTARSGTYTWSTPGWLALAVFTALAVTCVWSMLVCAIHWRGVTTGMAAKKRGRAGSGVWPRGWGMWRPFAKEARYGALQSGSVDDAGGEGGGGRERGVASAHAVSSGLERVSPVNLFLVPPSAAGGLSSRGLRPRDSAEWAAEHRAFFLGEGDGALTARSGVASEMRLLEGSERDDVKEEAREAQGGRASPIQRTEDASFRTEMGRGWVDLGLAVVDGAVDGFTRKIVRWTDGNGRDEELVLPLAKGKTD